MTLPLLPSFVVAGFECSTPINRHGQRIDELVLTQHDHHVREDYQRMCQTGICTARDGVRWNLVDHRGRLDFHCVGPFLDAAQAEDIHVIWDLFHYGYPEDLDPFSGAFVDRFAVYCHAFARLVRRRGLAPWYTPVNEISYFAWAAGEAGDFAPHARRRGPELKYQLCRASIAGMQAILSVEPEARFVHCEPLCRVVAPADAPHLAEEAAYFNYHCVHEAWDMIAGIKAPELGGRPRYLDVVGVNYYGLNQWEHQRPHSVLAPDDPRRLPFSAMLRELYARYTRPILLSETSSHQHLRPAWLRDIGSECLRALEHGVDLLGLCIYPIVDMFDWHDGRGPLGMGLWELRHAAGGERLERIEHEATVCELRRFQRRLARFTAARSRVVEAPVLAGPGARTRTRAPVQVGR